SHSSKRFTIVPDSALLILVGFAAGSVMDRFWPHEIYLHPDFFSSIYYHQLHWMPVMHYLIRLFLKILVPLYYMLW
ncbi:hypothetical protein LOAG_15689, partial [Loa loa]